MINKELLSEVLKVEIIHIFEFENNELRYNINPNEYTHTINVYELVHKCKEWCGRQGYVIMSDCYGTFEMYMHGATHPSEKEKMSKLFDSNEPEAVFKATQWVYDNKDK